MNKKEMIKASLMLSFIGGCSLLFGGCSRDMLSISQPVDYVQINSENFDSSKYYMNTDKQIIAADPYVIDGKDGYYYAYATSDKLSGYGFLSWRSKDLVSWEEVGIAYYTSKDTWGVKDFWAPEVTEYKGKYYMHYTAKDKDGAIKIGMAVSDAPSGPFKDLDHEPFFYPGYNVIDSNILIDDDGQIYMYYSRDCSENVVNGFNESHLYVVELDEMREVISDPILLLKPELNWETESGDYRWNEGPEILKRDNQYYLIYSANFYNSRNYSLGYAISDSPTGPFIKPDQNRLLYAESDWTHISGPGHNSFALSPDGKELYTNYHSHINTDGDGGVRQINLDKVGFRSDGSMYINGPSGTPQPLPSGTSELINLNEKIESIEVNGSTQSDTNLLVNGEVVYHQEMIEQEFSGRGPTTLAVHFKEEVQVTDFLIYGSSDSTYKPQIINIKLDDKSGLRDIDWEMPQLPGEALILSFDAVKTKSIMIEIANKGEYKLSELTFLGR